MILVGDCVEVMAGMPAASVDAICTDPPYHLAFMGKAWDSVTPGQSQHEHGRWAREAFRVLKPGGHLLAFGGTRTYHRLACAVEDAGFEIRDTIAWMYGSGFPKSLDVGKAIDKQRDDSADVDRVRAWFDSARRVAGKSLGAINEHMGLASNGGGLASTWTTNRTTRAVPTWEQWLTLKAFCSLADEMDAEVWRLNGRKGEPGDHYSDREVVSTREVSDIRNGHGRALGSSLFAGEVTGKIEHTTTAPATPDAERWQGWGTALKPAHEPIVVARKPLSGTVAQTVLEHGTGALNIDGCRVSGAPRATGTRSTPQGSSRTRQQAYDADPPSGRWPANVVLSHDQGGASRFFYVAKASSAERNAGLDGRNVHPTVKPVELMRWLVRLVTPPGGTVLDPFTGSGTTGCAAALEGFEFVGIERDPEYARIADARIKWWREHPEGVSLVRRLEAERETAATAFAGQLGLDNIA